MAAEGRPTRREKLKQDALVDKLRPDPAREADAKLLVGFLGKSTRAGHWRLYVTDDLDGYLELAEEDVLHSQQLSGDDFPLGGTLLWVKRDASVRVHRTVSRDVQAEFLQGGIATAFLPQTPTPAFPGGGPTPYAFTYGKTTCGHWTCWGMSCVVSECQATFNAPCYTCQNPGDGCDKPCAR